MTDKYVLRGKYRTRLENAVLILENANGKSRTKLMKAIDSNYTIFMEIISDLKEVDFIKEETKIYPLSTKTNTPRLALSTDPKTVTRWYYTITDGGTHFLKVYHEMMVMLRKERR